METNEVVFNIVGAGQIRLPKREIRGYYKDFITGDTLVQVVDRADIRMDLPRNTIVARGICS